MSYSNENKCQFLVCTIYKETKRNVTELMIYLPFESSKENIK